ncbi:MAG: Nif3-like dinuclear metal center hexameric protein [Zoogloeaceae bacterium]|nr:Nif3-like dinuclear metal center hexameric protein [Zoogloeaceae bacterium]
MQREALQNYLGRILDPTGLKDYSPNGLQVEGRQQVGRLACGVTASQALLDAAVAWQADAILVHHGYFWKGEDGRVTGIRRRRLATLLAGDINLFAYHLPLDLHPEFGNNAQLGRLLGWSGQSAFGEMGLGWLAELEAGVSSKELAQWVGIQLGRAPLLVGPTDRTVKRVAWCTGAAQGLFEAAIHAGADLYLSGEISEQTVHLARETGVTYLAAGHHATERYGVQAVGRRIQADLGIEVQFFDVDNPV